MNITQFLLSLLIATAFIVGCVVSIRYEQEAKRRKQVELERVQREEKKQFKIVLKKEQERLGQFFLASLSRAAEANTVSNMLLSGEYSNTIKRIVASGKMEDNGAFSLFLIMGEVSTNSPNPWVQAHLIAQISICLAKTGREILVTRGPYGPERYYELANFPEVVDKLCVYAEKFRFFVVDKEDTLFT